MARRLTQNRQPLNFKDDEEKAKFKELVFAQAEKAVRLSLILERVREQYQVVVTRCRPGKRVRPSGAAPRSGGEGDPQVLQRGEKSLAELKDHLLQVKINDFLKEKIKVKEV